MTLKGEIAATTGLQRQNLNLLSEETYNLLKDTLKSDDKKIDFLATSLRSASKIYKEGGHVTMIYKDQSYSLFYDNKRRIESDSENTLKDSLPLNDTQEGLIYRKLSLSGSKSIYLKNLSQKTVKKYKSYLELGIRNFVKALFNNDLNLDSGAFSNYNELITFINQFKYKGSKYRLTANNIAVLKRRKHSRVSLPETPEVVSFSLYIKERFPNKRILKTKKVNV